MWQGHTVSVVLPAYNEEQNIARAVFDFRGVGLVDEVLVVDNNSRDATARIAEQAGARVVSERRQGYGAALQGGLREASGDLVVLCEPDGTFFARDIKKFLAYSEDFEVVLGTRNTPQLIWKEANMGWFLRWGNWTVAKAIEVLFGGPSLSDCGCTYRLLHRPALNRILPRLSVTGSHFLVDFTITALQEELRTLEIPVNYGKRVGTSKITGTFWGAFRTGMRMIGHVLARRLGL